MKIHATRVSRLLLITGVGAGLGLLVWHGINAAGWNKSVAWVEDLILPKLLPILALAWVGNLIVYGLLLKASAARSSAIKGLTTMLTLWLCTTFVILGVYYANGTAYANHLRVLGGAAYLASGLNFGLILAPMHIIHIFQHRYWCLKAP